MELARPVRSWMLVTMMPALLLATAPAGAEIVQILDATGDGAGHVLAPPTALATGPDGSVYVPSATSDVLRVTPAGAVAAIGGGVTTAFDLVVDSAANVYVTGGAAGENVVRIAPGGATTQVVSYQEEDASGNGFEFPYVIAAGPADEVYFGAVLSSNAFEILPGGGIDQVIDSSGDGSGVVTYCDEFLAECTWEGNALLSVTGIAVGPTGNVYVSGNVTDNVFEITPGGTITQIIDASGDGAGNPLDGAGSLAVDSSGNVFVVGSNSHNVFEIAPGGAVTELIDATGDGLGHVLDTPTSVAVDSAGHVYVTGWWTHNVFRITPAGEITQVMDASGDGAGHPLDRPSDVAVDPSGNVYVAGYGSNNVFRISQAAAVPSLGPPAGVVLSLAIAVSAWRRARRSRPPPARSRRRGLSPLVSRGGSRPPRSPRVRLRLLHACGAGEVQVRGPGNE